MNKPALIVAAVALMPGCALSPGMRMNEEAAVARGRATAGDSYHVERIDSALVARLANERRPAELLGDPLAVEATSYRYRISPHDVLQVIVWDHPELTAPSGQFRSPEENGNLVNSDGTIFYPYVGTLQVAGKTVAEVRDLLTERLSQVIQKPQLDVRVTSFRGKKVQVTGEVLGPTTVPIIDVPLRVQDALAAAKGFTPEADYSRVTLARDGKTFVLNLQALYELGDASQNWLLKDGDVVNVPDRSQNKVFVLGEVRAQHAKLMVKGRMTLAEALTDTVGGQGVSTIVNGFDPSASDVSKIYVIRGSFEAPKIYHLDASSADALLLATKFPMEPRDVVFVSTYTLARFNRVISQILPTVQLMYDLAITGDLIYRAR